MSFMAVRREMAFAQDLFGGFWSRALGKVSFAETHGSGLKGEILGHKGYCQTIPCQSVGDRELSRYGVLSGTREERGRNVAELSGAKVESLENVPHLIERENCLECKVPFQGSDGI
jgi:hypothetical protein